MKYKVIIEPTKNDSPKDFEIRAAGILTTFFRSDIIMRRSGHCTSPDMLVVRLNQVWELKSPIGDGKKTIENNIREAKRQSDLVIIDLYRSKLHQRVAISRVKAYLNKNKRGIRKLIVITKDGKVIDLFA